MKNSATATAASATVRIGGKSYRMRPWTWEDYGSMDLWMQDKALAHMHSEVIAKLPDADRIAVRKEIAMQAASVSFNVMPGDLSDTAILSGRIATSIEGLAQIMWLSFRAEHPDLKPETIRGWLVDEKTTDRLMNLYDRLNAGAKKKRGTRTKKKAGVKNKKKKTSR